MHTPTHIQDCYNKILKSVKSQLEIWSIFNIDKSQKFIFTKNKAS